MRRGDPRVRGTGPARGPRLLAVGDVRAVPFRPEVIRHLLFQEEIQRRHGLGRCPAAAAVARVRVPGDSQAVLAEREHRRVGGVQPAGHRQGSGDRQEARGRAGHPGVRTRAQHVRGGHRERGDRQVLRHHRGRPGPQLRLQDGPLLPRPAQPRGGRAVRQDRQGRRGGHRPQRPHGRGGDRHPEGAPRPGDRRAHPEPDARRHMDGHRNQPARGARGVPHRKGDWQEKQRQVRHILASVPAGRRPPHKRREGVRTRQEPQDGEGPVRQRRLHHRL